MTSVFELPTGTRIRILKVHIYDAWYKCKDDIEGNIFIATEPKFDGLSMYFKDEKTGIEYCFYADTTYEII